MDEEAHARREGAAEVDAYWQRVREEGEDCHAGISESSVSARAMKEGAAEVDAYWCHAASSECYTSTLAQAIIMKRGLALNHGNLLGLPLGQLQLNLGKLQGLPLSQLQLIRVLLGVLQGECRVPPVV